MADIIFTNNATSLLAATIDDLDTIIQLGAGDGVLFPSPSGSQYFVASLENDAGDIEIIKVTSRTGDLLTVVRGHDNSTAQAFTLTVTRVELRLTAAVMGEFVQVNGDTLTGNLDLNGNELQNAELTGATVITGGQSVGMSIRGTLDQTNNEIVVPAGSGVRATAGGADIVVATDDVTSQIASATESAEGVAEIATQVETDAGTDDARFITPLKLNARAASEALTGILAIADQTETDAGTDDAKAITPLKLTARAASEALTGILAIASQAEVDTGTDDTKAITPLKLAASLSGVDNSRGALVFAAGSQTIPISVETVVAFPSEAYDTDGVHDLITNNSRLTVPAGVTKIRLSGGTNWQLNNTGQRQLRIKKNGGSGGVDNARGAYIPMVLSGAGGAATSIGMVLVTGIIETVEDDYFELFVEHNRQNGVLDILAGTSWFEMEILG